VLDLNSFKQSGIHGKYPWFDEYSGLSYNEMTLEYVTERYKPTVVTVCPASDALMHITKHGGAACNTLYILQSTGCCNYMHSLYDRSYADVPVKDCWAFECSRGIVEHFLPISSSKYDIAQARGSPLNTVYSRDEYNVAIHIRIGDIQPHFGDTQFFTNMIQSTVHTYLSHMPVHIYYIGQFGSVSDNTKIMTDSITADWSFQ
jgi:hypothetical protein